MTGLAWWAGGARPEHLRAVEDEINRRPRLVLDDHAPADLFARLLASAG